MKIGMIGLDTSHCTAFTRLLNDPRANFHVPGGKVVVAYPGGSSDFALSRSRVEGITQELKESFGIQMAAGCEEVAAAVDGILLTSVDGRIHREQFEKVAPYGRPVFIDKPLAVSSQDADHILETAQEHGVPLLSTSALRYAEPLVEVLEEGEIFGVDCYGPMNLEETQPGLFWYGIHGVEMMYAVLGRGCERVTAYSNSQQDVIVGEWSDGRIGTYRGNRQGNREFGAVVHRAEGSSHADVSHAAKPFYASLLEQVMKLFQTRIAPVDAEETREIIRFMEAANESRETGRTVSLAARGKRSRPGRGSLA